IEVVSDGNLRSCLSGRGGLGDTREFRRAFFQETKWKGSSTKEGNGYRLCDRIISLTLVIEGETVNVISVYAPQVGLGKDGKKTLWDSLDEVVRVFPTDQRLILGGDLNGHIGEATEGYPEGRKEVVTLSILPQFDCYYSRISQSEVKTALQKMGRNKAVGPNKIPIEAWRSLGDEGIIWLTNLFNKIFTSAKMPEEWRLSEVISIFKNKDDAQAIHLIRSLMEKYRKRQRDLHLAFLDLEKAYDSVPRELIWKTLVDKGTSRRYIKVIKDMYDGARTRVRTPIGNTEFFLVEVGLHQGSAISPYLFALILNDLSRGIQEDISWCLIFADDIALVSESAEGLNNRLENWREALEDNGLRVSKEKTEYLRCDFGKVEIAHNEEVDIRIGDKILQPKESFRYLGSMTHKSERIDEDVSHRIKTAWLKMEVAELRMLKWTCGKTMLNMIPNGVYRPELEVETIINKMREGRLRRFGHIRRRPQLAPVRRVEALVVDGVRRRGTSGGLESV
nr:hypothetical protein [Tanacetum cinerariifolium]